MPGKSFTKGDPRINRKGRPRTFDALRTLAQDIAHEEAKDANGQTITVNGKGVTIAEAILRKWATSKDPRLQINFMEVAFGKTPVENRNVDIDLSKLSSEQLERVAAGEDVIKVIVDGYSSST